ncbi:MAG: DEAD/DEAH box helicase family protein [Candidatus Nanoarchaeia archaeon]|nr:DEAD/DEAH box helicase family protein [Candidatus Nanoarchaeia archaeon]
MKFKFDGNLDYQLEAIKSVITLFRGQKNTTKSFLFIAENGIVPNELGISKKIILDNLKAIQKENNINESEKLEGDDFSIEMETGTGKTYVYLRTILELNREYGFKKFIIIVPSVAIREGVLKTLEITKQHLKQIYDNIPYNFCEYDSNQLSRIRQFSRNNNIEILVMTLDSFNKDTNIMNQNIDRLSGQKPIDLVSQTRPILILDEPQNMESDKSKEALKKLNPLFKLRYSATHRNYYNLIYRLTPVDAYNKGLVKKIEVLSVVKEDDFNNVYIKCLDIISDDRGIRAKIEINQKQKSRYKAKSIIVKQGDDLFKKSENNEYKGIIIAGIHAGYGHLKLSNGIIIKKGEDFGGDKKELMRIQIKHTIEEHFRKQEILKPFKIKVLSLFFIDRVSNYTEKEGFIRKAFTEEFEKIKLKFPAAKGLEVNKVHNGYFSNYKSESGMETDKKAFDLIMRDKEKLLSFEEPTQFIFSHSALREGWDNPNVFNICTLNETISEMRKRQEIGRGVRLPVNQEGDRITDLDFNILTVIANESYSDYVSTLQKEYIDEYGDLIAPPKPANARNRKILKLKKGFKLNPEFKELWQRISKKTIYSVDINVPELLKECIEEINKLTINTIRIRVEKVSLSINDKEGIKIQFVGDEAEELNKDFGIPDLIERVSSETYLTRNTIYEILSRIHNLSLIFKNPQEFTQSVSLIINEKLKEFLINGIKYLELKESWQMELFEDLEAYEDYIITDYNNKTVYEGTIWDSNGEKEFAKQLEDDNKIKMFVKLPPWFIVKTPIGEYNPDWAIVFEEKDLQGQIKDKLYLVRETKFVDNLHNLRYSEQHKIKCAEEHFKTINVNFKTIKNFQEII